MVDRIGPSNQSQGKQNLASLPAQAPEEGLIDEDGNYILSEASIAGDYRLSFSSTLFADLSIKGSSNTTGKSTALGVQLPLLPPYNKFQLYMGHGETTIGLEIPTMMPRIGFGNITMGPGGLSLGWFSVTSAPDPWLFLAGGLIILLQTILEGCDSGSDCALKYTSGILNSATPINTLREFVQMMGIDTSEDACGAIWEQTSYDRCLLYSASYMSQKLFTVAKDMVNNGLKDTMADPYVRATLLEERDRIRFAKSRGGISTSSNTEIADNMRSAADETQDFLTRYEGWLSGGEGEEPSADEKHKFLGSSLYLLRKLQTSAVVDGKKLRITGGAPVAFKKDADMTAFLKTVASIYSHFASSSRLWDFISKQLTDDASDLTTGSDDLSPELLIARWFRHKNLTGLKKEITSVHMHTLFNLRKIHLIAKARAIKPKERSDRLVLELSSVKLAKRELVEEQQRQSMGKHIDSIDSAQFIAEAPAIFNGLERMLRLSYKRDPLAEVRGLDLTGLDDTPPYRTAFISLYDLAVMQTKETSPLYLQAIKRKSEALLNRVVKNHESQIKRELKNYDRTMKVKLRRMSNRLKKTLKLVEDKAAHADLEKRVADFRADMESALIKDDIIERPDLQALIATSDEISSWFEKLALSMMEVFQAEEERLAGKGDEEALEKWRAKAQEVAESVTRSFHEIMSLRQSATMMKLHLEKKPGKGGQDV